MSRENYGEELAYWYLRLNGFFLLENFVIHRTEEIKHSSDIDLMAVRLPFVYEEIGGKPDDWDENLLNNLDPSKVIGILCEAKTGEYNEKELFKSHYIKYALNRFGFIPDLSRYVDMVLNRAIYNIPDSNFQVAKLLVVNQGQIPEQREEFICVSIPEIREFLHQRIEKYIHNKWQDRLFFKTSYLEDLIDRVKHECEKQEK